MPRVYNIETFPIDTVNGEALPTNILGFEELPVLARTILENCPVICDSIDDKANPTLNFENLAEYDITNNENYRLTQASPKHLRSFILKGGDFEKVWHDENGNLFSSISLKGNNFANSMLMETATATDRFIAFGLQESAVIRRVIRASSVLRKAGISTEYIVGLTEPKEFLIRENGMAVNQIPVGIDGYKHFLIEKHWSNLPNEERTFEAYFDISKKMERSTYYISMRAMDSDYRYYDAANFPTARSDVYKQIQNYFGVELDIYNTDDWQKYTNEFFIPLVTNNLAKLHKLGIAHKFPNSLNVSAFGGIVDLDSVHGEILELGDEPITIEDMANDIFMLAHSDDYTPFGMFNSGVTDFRKKIISEYYKQIDTIYDPDTAKQFKMDLGVALHKITENPTIKKYVADLLAREIIDDNMINGITVKWLQDNDQHLTDEMNRIFEGRLDYYANWLLFDAVLNSYNISDKNFDYFNQFLNLDTLYNNETSEVPNYDLSGTFDEIFKDLITGKVGNNYNQYILDKIDYLKLPKYKDIELSEDLKDIIVASIAEIYEDGRAFDNWLNQKVMSTLPEYKERLNKLANDYLVEKLFEDYKSTEIIVADNRRVITETNGVSFAGIIDYARTNRIEVRVNKPIDEEAEFVLAHDYITSEDAELIQIICEVPLDGWEPQCEDKDSELRISGMICHSTDNDYIVFVEKKNDGKHRLVINLKNQKLIEQLSEASQSEIYRMLRQDTVGNDRLFDVRPYYKRREFTEFLLGVSLSEI